MLNWTHWDSWISLTGALIAMACSIPGIFLLLKRQSMLGHGISHAVLPGLLAAFIFTGTRSLPAMMVGAAIAGICVAFMTQFFEKKGGVEAGAALGVSFTSLFAFGLILIRAHVDSVHIDPDCVLFGVLELAVVDSDFPPKVTIQSGVILIINMILFAVFYKELRIATFDPEFADAQGFKSQFFHYAIMVMTAVTSVIAFESVGSILVIAMLIGPPAAAYVISQSLIGLFLWTLIFAASSAVVGHILSISLFSWASEQLFGLTDIGATNTAGGIAVVSTLLFCFLLTIKQLKHKFV